MLKHRIAAARNGRIRDDDKGFTLVELLIVIVVLGVLAGIVVFGVAQFQGDSDIAACEASLETVETAADAFLARGQEELTAGEAGITQLVNGNYLEEAPNGDWEITVDAEGNATSGLEGCGEDA